MQSFCNDINDCNYIISTNLFQHILHLNSYEKIGYSEYYSLKNNNDLPNYLKAFKINDKEVSINIRAWMHKKPKDFFYHSRTIILKRLVPYLPKISQKASPNAGGDEWP